MGKVFNWVVLEPFAHFFGFHTVNLSGQAMDFRKSIYYDICAPITTGEKITPLFKSLDESLAAIALVPCGGDSFCWLLMFSLLMYYF